MYNVTLNVAIENGNILMDITGNREALQSILTTYTPCRMEDVMKCLNEGFPFQHSWGWSHVTVTVTA